MGLLDGVKGILTNTVVDKAADVLGIENKLMKSAMKMFLPAVIGGLINKGSTPTGAGGLLDLFKNGGFGQGQNNDLMSVLGDSDKSKGMLETGTDLLGTIFGNNQTGVLDTLLKATGIGKSGGSTLLSFIAPIVVNKLASLVFKKDMNAAGLSSYLNDQKSDVMGLVPGLSGLLGGASASLGAAADRPKTVASSDASGGGIGFLKYLLPLLILGGLAYWWMNRDKSVDSSSATKTEATTTKSSDTETTAPATTTMEATDETTTNETVKGATGTTAYTIGSNGDVLNPSGSVAFAKGSYKLDAENNLVGMDGKIILPAASISSDLMAKLKAAIGRISSGATLEQMKSMFDDMIIKKAGANSSYGLSNIEFNSEDHKISNFSKAEVQGLAAALKANEKGKIEVQVHTNDGKDDKENDKLSEMRANVIRDMLVTLGVSKKQIKAIGMGSKDATKAGSKKVEIVIK